MKNWQKELDNRIFEALQQHEDVELTEEEIKILAEKMMKCYKTEKSF